MPAVITRGAFSAKAFGFTGKKAGGSDATIGIFALGYLCGVSSTTRNKYTFSNDTVGTGGVATAASHYGSAAGNSTRGIFALGYTTGPSTTRNKYTYACDSVTTGGIATAASYGGSAASNGTCGVNV